MSRWAVSGVLGRTLQREITQQPSMTSNGLALESPFAASALPMRLREQDHSIAQTATGLAFLPALISLKLRAALEV